MTVDVTVIGSGSWGSAFARHLSRRGHRVQVLSLTAAEAAELSETRENPSFLPGVRLPDELVFAAMQDAEIAGADLIVYAVPTQAVREVAAWVAPQRAPGSLQRPTQVIREVTGSPAAALSGPNHAEEIGRDMPSATVIASVDMTVAERLQKAIAGETLRVYTNDDVLGVESCGAMKNPIAVAVGMSDGLGYGDNSRAALMTRGLAEVARLGLAQGARFETFSGLAGVGDLIATCTSRHSRNRRAGELLARGATPAEAAAEVGQVVEGFPTAYALHDLAARYAVEIPVTENVYEVLEGRRTPSACVAALMGRVQKRE